MKDRMKYIGVDICAVPRCLISGTASSGAYYPLYSSLSKVLGGPTARFRPWLDLPRSVTSHDDVDRRSSKMKNGTTLIRFYFPVKYNWEASKKPMVWLSWGEWVGILWGSYVVTSDGVQDLRGSPSGVFFLSRHWSCTNSANHENLHSAIATCNKLLSALCAFVQDVCVFLKYLAILGWGVEEPGRFWFRTVARKFSFRGLWVSAGGFTLKKSDKNNLIIVFRFLGAIPQWRRDWRKCKTKGGNHPVLQVWETFKATDQMNFGIVKIGINALFTAHFKRIQVSARKSRSNFRKYLLQPAYGCLTLRWRTIHAVPSSPLTSDN